MLPSTKRCGSDITVKVMLNKENIIPAIEMREKRIIEAVGQKTGPYWLLSPCIGRNIHTDRQKAE
jgi:hypothetical protein